MVGKGGATEHRVASTLFAPREPPAGHLPGIAGGKRLFGDHSMAAVRTGASWGLAQPPALSSRASLPRSGAVLGVTGAMDPQEDVEALVRRSQEGDHDAFA